MTDTSLFRSKLNEKRTDPQIDQSLDFINGHESRKEATESHLIDTKNIMEV